MADLDSDVPMDAARPKQFNRLKLTSDNGMTLELPGTAILGTLLDLLPMKSWLGRVAGVAAASLMLRCGVHLQPLGSAVSGSDGQSATGQLIDHGRISVTDYGAVGDGVTDGTAAINAAMAACTGKAAPKNGCALYFPAGVYITTGLTMQSFVHFRGDGWATSVIKLKPNTSADVISIPVNAFNFSLIGLTIDGNATHGGHGNCLSVAVTGLGPAAFNTANKQVADANAQKWGHVEEVMFSNCSGDGVHINHYNYMLFFDNFYSFNNGVYGLFTEGTNSGFSNFQIERNGTAGIHISNANNRFTSGEVIWNAGRNNGEAAVYVSGARNILTAIEAEDNYTNGFFDNGKDDEFIGCVSDSNGYAPRNPDASSRKASGFVINGQGGVYVGDKVTSYRGRLSDGNFTTEWPYTIGKQVQSRIDISYDSTNQPPSIRLDIPQTGTPITGRVACVKSAGPPVVIGYCTTTLDAAGGCNCQ